MAAREALARIIYDDGIMNTLGYTDDNIWAANSVDTPADQKQFIVIKTDLVEKAFGITGVHIVEYWVHSSRSSTRDYANIDQALLRIREILVAVQQFAGGDGWTLTGASWVDVSGDLVDEAFNTICRFTTFRTAMHGMVEA